MIPQKLLYRTILIIFAMLLASVSTLHSQNDSLQGISHEELIERYNETLQKDLKKAKKYAQSALQVAQKNDQQEKIGWSHYYIAVVNYYEVNYEQALAHVRLSLSISEKTKDHYLSFKNYNLKGNIYSETKREKEALDNYFTAHKFAKLTQDPINSIIVSVNIALIKKEYHDHQEAIDLLIQNLHELEALTGEIPQRDFYKRLILSNLSDSYLRIKKTDEAKFYNDKSLEISSKEETPRSYYWALMNDAIINYQYKKYDDVIRISTEAETYFLENKQKDQLITPYYYIGKSYHQLKNHKKAVDFLEKAIQIANEENVTFLDRKEVHRFLSLSYSELGDSKNATYNLQKYSEIDAKNDSINISVNNKIHQEHDIVPLKEEIALLDDTNKKQQRRNTYLYISVIVLIATLLLFIIWYKRKQQQNKQRFQELLVTIEKLERSEENTVSEATSNETSNPVTDENAVQILEDLKDFEAKKLYLRQDCTLSYVAKKLKTNTTYLSSVINTYKEKSFKSYLTELRINEALIQLKNDSKLRSYTIKAIAAEFGFKRSETFSRAFKSQTNMYPSYYIKSLDNQLTTK